MSAGESYANNIEGVKQYQQKLQDDAIGGYDEMVADLTSDYNDTLTKYQDKWSSLQDAGVDDLLGLAGSKALITGGYKLYKHINRYRKPKAPDGTKVPERPPGEGGTTSGTATTEDASAGFDADAFDDFAAKNLARFGGSDTGGGLEDAGFSEKDAGDLFGEGEPPTTQDPLEFREAPTTQDPLEFREPRGPLDDDLGDDDPFGRGGQAGVPEPYEGNTPSDFFGGGRVGATTEGTFMDIDPYPERVGGEPTIFPKRGKLICSATPSIPTGLAD